MKKCNQWKFVFTSSKIDNYHVVQQEIWAKHRKQWRGDGRVRVYTIFCQRPLFDGDVPAKPAKHTPITKAP